MSGRDLPLVPSSANLAHERPDGPADLRWPFGPAILGAAVGVQAMLALFVGYGPGNGPPPDRPLTAWGEFCMHPENDLKIYLGGCALTLLVVLALYRVWGRRWVRVGAVPSVASFRGGWAIVPALAMMIALASPITIGVAHRIEWKLGHSAAVTALGCLVMLAPALLALAAYVAALRSGLVPTDVAPLGSRAETRVGPGARLALALLGVVLLVGVVYIPNWRSAAGEFLFYDKFSHWDFFVMGPALGYLHGGAIGTDVFCLYGIGWPVLVGLGLGRGWLDYGSVIHGGIVYGCFYYVALLLMLGAFVRDRVWAIAGALLIAALQTRLVLVGHDHPGWMWPSTTVLRWPFDIWVFLALVKHLDTGRRSWAVALGGFAGLSLVFATDTGEILVATLIAYFLLRLLAERSDPGAARRLGTDLLTALVAAGAVTLVGLVIGSRGTLLSAAFWSGYTEPQRLFAGGVQGRPMSILPAWLLLIFATMIGTYLALTGALVAEAIRGPVGRDLIVGGCVALYGLASLPPFINYSVVNNFYTRSAPFLVILTYLASRWLRGRVIPWCAVALVLLAYMAIPGWRVYPCAFRWAAGKTPASTGPRLSGVVLPGPDGEQFARDHAQVCAKLADLHSRGATVGVLDFGESVYYLGSGIRPQTRVGPMFALDFWKDSLARNQATFFGRRLDFIAAKSTPPPLHYSWDDVWDSYTGQLAQEYEPVDQAGSFVIWRRRAQEIDEAGQSPPASADHSEHTPPQ